MIFHSYVSLPEGSKRYILGRGRMAIGIKPALHCWELWRWNRGSEQQIGVSSVHMVGETTLWWYQHNYWKWPLIVVFPLTNGAMVLFIATIVNYYAWLVVCLPLWIIWTPIGMMKFPIYRWKIKDVRNHQPDMIGEISWWKMSHSHWWKM